MKANFSKDVTLAEDIDCMTCVEYTDPQTTGSPYVDTDPVFLPAGTIGQIRVGTGYAWANFCDTLLLLIMDPDTAPSAKCELSISSLES